MRRVVSATGSKERRRPRSLNGKLAEGKAAVRTEILFAGIVGNEKLTVRIAVFAHLCKQRKIAHVGTVFYQVKVGVNEDVAVVVDQIRRLQRSCSETVGQFFGGKKTAKP